MPGTIIRKAYHKKGYDRKAYTRSDGTKVHATHVKSAYVPAAAIKDLGAPGHGPKLINMKDYDHLRNYGYSMTAPKVERQAALRKAARAKRYSWVIHRLTAIRNLQHRTNPKNANKARKDAEYISAEYKKMKA